MKPVTVAMLFFALIAVVHIFRLIFGWDVIINGYAVPMSLSVVAILLAGGMTIWLYKS